MIYIREIILLKWGILKLYYIKNILNCTLKGSVKYVWGMRPTLT